MRPPLQNHGVTSCHSILAILNFIHYSHKFLFLLRMNIPKLSILILLFCSINVYSQKPELVIPTGNLAKVTCIAYSSDGKYIASGGYDFKIKLWDAETGDELKTYALYTDGVTSLTFTKSSKQIIAGYRDGKIICFDIISKDTLFTLKHDDCITSLHLSNDEKYLLSSSWDKTAKLWDLSTKKVYRTFPGNSKLNFALFSKSEKEILIADRDSTLSIYSIADTSQPDYSLRFRNGSVRCFDIHDSLLVCGSTTEDTIRLINLSLLKQRLNKDKYAIDANAVAIRKFHIGNGGVWVITFSKDGKLFAMGSRGYEDKNLVYVWSTGNNSKPLCTLAGHSDEIHALCFSPDDSKLLSGSYDKTMILWNYKPAKPYAEKIFKGHTGFVKSVCWSDDNNYIGVLYRNDKQIKVFNTQNNKTVNLCNNNDSVNGIEFSPYQSSLLTYEEGGTAKHWKIEDKLFEKNFFSTPKIIFKSSALNKISSVFSRGGDSLIFCDSSKYFQVFNLETNVTAKYRDSLVSKQFYSKVPERFDLIDFSDDLQYIIYTLPGSMDSCINIVYNGTGITKKLYPAYSRIDNLMLSPDKNFIICISIDSSDCDGNTKCRSKINIWKTETLEEIKLAVKDSNITSFRYFPSGKLLFVEGQKNDIELWDLGNVKKIKTFSGFKGVIKLLFISKDKKLLLSAGLQGKIDFYDFNSGALLATLTLLDTSDWVVTTPDGLFDASKNAQKRMHYVVGIEPVELEQLKFKFYTPGLLQKILNNEYQPGKALDELRLFPAVEDYAITKDSLNGIVTLRLDLVNRGGGFGKTYAWINKKGINESNISLTTLGKDTMKCTINLTKYLRTGEDNAIVVRTSNSEGTLVSREVRYSFTQPGKKRGTSDQQVFMVCCGISNYSGKDLHLTYADADAADVVSAFTDISSKLYSNANIHAYLFNTQQNEAGKLPDKNNILNALDDIRKSARPEDLIIIYLSGHGVNLDGPAGDFYFLTREASSRDINLYYDRAYRDSTTISGDTLIDFINSIPASKQFLIIDACNSGKMLVNTSGGKGVSSETQRVLEIMKDKTGMYILTGSEATALSYESSVYKHSLLTYSIIEEIARSQPGSSMGCIDVQDLINKTIVRTVDISAKLSSLQNPQKYFDPDAQSFCLGVINDSIRNLLPISTPLPVMLPATFQEEKFFCDTLAIADMLNFQFNEISKKYNAGFVYWPEDIVMPGAYNIKGRYKIKGNNVEVYGILFHGKSISLPFNYTLQKSALEQGIKSLAENLLKKVSGK